MSYPQHGNFSMFFKPKMAVAANDTKPLADIDIGATGADHGEWICVRACTVKELLFAVTLENVSGTTTPPTVIFTKRLTPGSSSGEAVMGTLTIPSGTAIGKVIYKKITPVEFQVGDVIEVSHTVGVGTPTGMGSAEIWAEYMPEIHGNNSDMIASA